MDLKGIWGVTKLSVALATGLSMYALIANPITATIAALIFAGFVLAIMDFWGPTMESPIIVALYVLMVYAAAVSVYQLVIFSAVVISLVIIAKKHVRLADSPHKTLVYSARTTGLAALAIISPIVLIYEAARRGPLLYRLYMILGAVGMALTLLGMAPLDLSGVARYAVAALNMNPILANVTPDYNPLFWVGAISWEEFISRLVGPLGNAFWVILHVPSRVVSLGSVLGAIGAASFIQIGARWIWDSYQRGGLIGAIVSHAVYNAVLSLMAEVNITLLPYVVLSAIMIYFATKPFGHA